MVTRGEIEIAEQIAFATASAEILRESDAILAAVARILDERPDILRVRIEGHTDATGPAEVNELLSRQRAAAVASWLVTHGISADRLATEGYGSRRPIADEASPEGRARNRRVVFTIVDRR